MAAKGEFSGQAEVLVTRQYKEGKLLIKEETLEEKIKVKTFAAPPATVGCRVKEVKNIGNYESIHIEVMASTPCYREEMSDAFEACYEFATTKLAFYMPDSVFAPEKGSKKKG